MQIGIIDDTQYKKIIKKPDCLLYFWSPWCGVCLHVTELQELEKTHPHFFIGSVYIEENNFLSNEFEILVAPTYLYLQYGKIIVKTVGKKTHKNLLQKILA
jgi:thioredoxin-like negative regulator of GroEL